MTDYEITQEEARILEDLAEMRESDPEGYEALIGDLGADASGAEEDPARAHAEQLLEMLSAGNQERDKQLFEVLNAAYQQRASEAEDSQP